MKKVLLLSVYLITSFLLGGGGKSWASVTFTNGTLTIDVTNTPSSQDETDLNNIVNGNSNVITKIIFSGGGKVTNQFVQKLNYHVNSVTVLDMGGITVDDLSSSSIPLGLDFSKVTEVTVPKTKEENGEMTFPKNVFQTYEWTNVQSGKGITKLFFPEGYTTIADEAFPDSYGFNWLHTLAFPSTLKTIGKKAFVQKSSLSKVTFPENLDKIDDGAFSLCTSLKNLKFNSKLRFIGNSAFAVFQIKETTLIIPASVKYIGPSAFYGHEYQDVYFQGEKAPIMPCGTSVTNSSLAGVENTAFPANTLMGNNGFQRNGGQSTHDNAETGWANRDNYYNDAYFCVLHYPANLSEENKNTYVDVTRVYLTKTEGTFNYTESYKVGKESAALSTGTHTAGSYNDGFTNVEYGYKDTYLGEQYIWPSQNQWMRAYITAALGLCWNGVDTYRPTLTQEEKDIYAEAGYVIGTGEGQYTEDELSKMAHQGTRMFVLANPDAQKDKYNPGNIKKDGTWWTICVPFNMTKKQVLDTFGENTQLCLFDQVTRQIDPDGKKHLLIRFATNPMKNKTSYADGTKAKFTTSENEDQDDGHAAGEWDYKSISGGDVVNEPGDDDIVIWAHESYMIKPDDGVNSDKDPVTIANYEPVPGNPLPSVVRAKTTTVSQDQSTDDYDNHYCFIGNYISGLRMPQYSYFFGTGSNGDKTEKFRFYTGTASNWKANKSLIETHAHDGGYQDYINFFGGDATNAKVTQATVFGKDDNNGDTTAIDDIQIQVGDDVLTPIFSLDGKMVSLSGDTTGLAKGVYVKAGKKFIVR